MIGSVRPYVNFLEEASWTDGNRRTLGQGWLRDEQRQWIDDDSDGLTNGYMETVDKYLRKDYNYDTYRFFVNTGNFVSILPSANFWVATRCHNLLHVYGRYSFGLALGTSLGVYTVSYQDTIEYGRNGIAAGLADDSGNATSRTYPLASLVSISLDKINIR